VTISVITDCQTCLLLAAHFFTSSLRWYLVQLVKGKLCTVTTWLLKR